MQCKKSKSNILHCVSRMQFKDTSTSILQGATCEQHAIFNQQVLATCNQGYSKVRRICNSALIKEIHCSMCVGAWRLHEEFNLWLLCFGWFELAMFCWPKAVSDVPQPNLRDIDSWYWIDHIAWLSKIWKSWKSQGIKSWSGKTWRTWKSQGILLKEPKMLLETMLFHTETRPCTNFGNFSWKNDEVHLRCVLLMQNPLLHMHNISSAIIVSNWLNTFRYGHLKRFSNGKMQNFLWLSNQGGLPEFLSLWK